MRHGFNGTIYLDEGFKKKSIDAMTSPIVKGGNADWQITKKESGDRGVSAIQSGLKNTGRSEIAPGPKSGNRFLTYDQRVSNLSKKNQDKLFQMKEARARAAMEARIAAGKKSAERVSAARQAAAHNKIANDKLKSAMEANEKKALESAKRAKNLKLAGGIGLGLAAAGGLGYLGYRAYKHNKDKTNK